MSGALEIVIAIAALAVVMVIGLRGIFALACAGAVAFCLVKMVAG